MARSTAAAATVVQNTHVMAGRSVTSSFYQDTVMQVIVMHLDQITDDARGVSRCST
jgi:hypothetical protein